MSDAKTSVAEIVDAFVKSFRSEQPSRRFSNGSGYDYTEKVGKAGELSLTTYRNPDAADGFRYSLNSNRERNGQTRLGNSYDVKSLIVEPLRIEGLVRYFTTRPEVTTETKTLLLEFMKYIEPAVNFSRAYIRTMAVVNDENKKPTNGRAEESPERQSA